MELGDLEVIATLGVGGFGRVELVKVIIIMIVPRMTTVDQCRDRRPSLVFALKVMSKQHLLETLQQEHVFSEREVMAACSHQFITRWGDTSRAAGGVCLTLLCWQDLQNIQGQKIYLPAHGGVTRRGAVDHSQK